MTNSGARPWNVGAWLRGLGLGQYEATFRENEIDESVPTEPDGGGLEGAGRRPSRASAKAARRQAARQPMACLPSD